MQPDLTQCVVFNVTYAGCIRFMCSHRNDLCREYFEAIYIDPIVSVPPTKVAYIDHHQWTAVPVSNQIILYPLLELDNFITAQSFNRITVAKLLIVS